MRLAQASSKFNGVHFDGWYEAGERWVPQVGRGMFQVYDRFITNKTFGAKKRILMIGALHPDIPKGISHIRTSDGSIYLLVSRNPDIALEGEYAAVYLIAVCDFTCRVVKTQRALNEHGMPVAGVEAFSAPVYCDMEAYSAAASGEFPAITYSTFAFSLPTYVDVTPDDQLEVASVRYDVKEVNPQLLTKAVVAIELGAS